ncbi:ComE operon protein 3 [Halolactibacillus halophilus]|uniref:ComE operon protein 3 n=1 Tax=Halolactibacillus halophilus TaxID=306540 RepID=A0ABQ0VJ98_9BACI|nr:ComE operon protein 3 [Halolactibacillus halophilus]
MKQQTDTYQRFIIQPDNQPTNVLITHFNPLDFDLVKGQHLRLDVSFEPPESPQNPGMFDYDRYLLTENVAAQAVAETVHYEGESLFSPIFTYRLKFLYHLQSRLSETTFGLVSALVLGEKSLLDDEFKDLFTRWHLTHLLAISGLHVGLMVHMLSLFLTRICRLNKETTWLVLLLVFLTFPFIAGGTPSVFRASLVGLLGYLALIIRTKLSTLDALSFVFLFLIMIKPYWLFQLGFQYSFLVTFSIVLSRPILSRYKHALTSLIFITALSFLITLPLQLTKFYSVNLVSLVINPPVNLLFSLLIIPLCFGIAVIALFVPMLLPVMDHILMTIFNGLFLLLSTIDRFCYFPFITGRPYLLHLILYAVSLFLLLRFIDQEKYRQASRYGILIVIIISLIKIMPYFEPYGQVTQLSIGQADVLVMELPHRKGVYLYDVGATTGKDYIEVTDEAYTRVIKPFLHYRGIHKIDGVFLSHSHQDHIGSLPFLVEDFSVEGIYIHSSFDEDSKLPYLDYTTLKVGQRYRMQQHNFDIVLPITQSLDPNDNSMVIHTTFGPFSFLLTGDISAEQESVFLAQYPDKDMDVLTVAHHGSQTSTSAALLEQLSPKYAIISVGLNNNFHHPHPDVITRLKAHHIQLFRTDTDGAVIYRFHKNNGTYQWYTNNQG